MSKRIYLQSLCLIIAVVLEACAPLLPTAPPVESLPQEKLETVVAGTGVAAQTQTASLLSPTFTPSPTRTPSKTPTPVTPTPTFFFSIATFTPLPTQTSLIPTTNSSSGSGSGTGGSNGNSIFTQREWTCLVTSKSPPKDAVIGAGKSFFAFITFQNTGTKTWTNNGVDLVYRGGFRHEGTRIQDLPATITPGNSISMKILFHAPKKAGLYKSNWSLQVGNNPFCGVRISFEVK